jgi:hypothetical protein
MLVIIVWPKVRRVLSGEKVVISMLLGANMTTPESKFTLAGQNAIVQNSNRITVNRDDPIPMEVESGILAMEELLRGVANEWYVFFCCRVTHCCSTPVKSAHPCC